MTNYTLLDVLALMGTSNRIEEHWGDGCKSEMSIFFVM
jgi:hypothetical protein